MLQAPSRREPFFESLEERRMMSTTSYLNLVVKGVQVKGDVTTANYQHQIALTAWQWDATNHSKPTASSPQATAPTTDGFSFTKIADSSTPALAGLAEASTSIDSATIDVLRPDANSRPTLLMEIRLEQVIVSSYSQSASSDLPQETVQLSFGREKITYYTPSTTGGSPTTTTTGWDFIRGTPINSSTPTSPKVSSPKRVKASKSLVKAHRALA